MKKTFLKLSIAFAFVSAFFGMASCGDSETTDNRMFSDFFTVTGSMPNYVLLNDEGVEIHPTSSSVSELTGGKGFTDKRVFLTGIYEAKNQSEVSGHTVVKNAQLYGGQSIDVKKFITDAEAEATGVLNPDSIFPIMMFKRIYIANGYMNTIVTASYSAVKGNGIMPTRTLYIDNAKTANNSVTLKFLYNRHTPKNVDAAGTTDFSNSFDVTGISVPGSDSIAVNIETDGVSVVKFKAARSAFVRKW